MALGIPAYLIGVHLWTWVFNVHAFLAGYADFSRLYISGYMLRLGFGHQLYDSPLRDQLQNQLTPGLAFPFDHPAYEALLYAPFSMLGYRVAYLAFLAFNVGLLALAFWLMQPWLKNLRQVYWWLPGALFFAFLPICVALIQGQDSILLLLLLVAAFRYLNAGRDFAAGFLIAIGLFKFQLVLPVAFLFLLWRRWRFVGGFSIAATAVICTSLWVAGSSQSSAYARLLLSMSIHSASSADRLKFSLEPNAMANLRGVLFGLMNGCLSNFWIQLLTLVLSCAVLGWIAIAASRKSAGDLLLIAITATGLVSYHMLIQDMAILLLPALVTMDRFIYLETSIRTTERFKFRSAVLLFVAPVLMSWAPAHFYLAALPLVIFMYAVSAPTSFAISSSVGTLPQEPASA